MKPILFNTDMVRANMYGWKTETRRVIKDPYYIDDELFCRKSGLAIHKGTNITDGMPYPDSPWSPGDILYVRETWGDYREHSADGEGPYFLYRADFPDGAKTYQYPGGPICDLPRWHPSIHMPKEAARLFLRVGDVRVEKLQEIDGAGIKAEGTDGMFGPTLNAFVRLWDSTIKPADRDAYGWSANPWVWVIVYERITREEALAHENR